MITAIASPVSSTSRGLQLPARRAIDDGSPKMPLPTMQFTASATMLQRPMTRTSCGVVLRVASDGIALLYHKLRARVRYSYATHLECSATGERHDIGRLQGLSTAGKPLLARYDLAALQRELTRADIESRPPGLWRWRELLPVPEPRHVVSLGEVETPLIELTNSARPAGFIAPIVKDEGRLPTGSFKARGLALAVSMAGVFGVRRVAIP